MIFAIFYNSLQNVITFKSKRLRNSYCVFLHLTQETELNSWRLLYLPLKPKIDKTRSIDMRRRRSRVGGSREFQIPVRLWRRLSGASGLLWPAKAPVKRWYWQFLWWTVPALLLLLLLDREEYRLLGAARRWGDARRLAAMAGRGLMAQWRRKKNIQNPSLSNRGTKVVWSGVLDSTDSGIGPNKWKVLGLSWA